jgi:hypothetical protein
MTADANSILINDGPDKLRSLTDGAKRFKRNETKLDTETNQNKRITFTAFSKILLSTASRYLVKGIIPIVGLVVVWGAPKCGKSFFVFDMVMHICAGWKYRGRRVKQCPAIYFALEGQEGFVARIEAFRQVHGVSDVPFYLSADRIVLPQDGAAIVQVAEDAAGARQQNMLNEPAGPSGHGNGGRDQRQDGLAGDGGRTTAAR